MMKKIMLALCILLVSFSFITEVYAKRFGGGRSFGSTRSSSSVFSRASNSSLSHPLSRARSWLAPLAGFALGGMLATLFMGHGLGSGILTWVAIIAGIYLLTQFIRRKSHQPAFSNNQYQNDRPASPLTSPFNNNTFSNSDPYNQDRNRNEFNENEFLRTAKSNFIRLQAAYDDKNLNDIRQFTTPEVFAEIKIQISEREEGAQNYTEIVSLNAELADSSHLTASVRFSGMISEEKNQPAHAFTEIWHFERDEIAMQWKVSGLQQEISGIKV